MDRKRDGEGLILKKEYTKNVAEVKSVVVQGPECEVEIEGVMMNVVSGCAPQVG